MLDDPGMRDELVRGVAAILSMMSVAVDAGDADVRMAEALRVLGMALEGRWS